MLERWCRQLVALGKRRPKLRWPLTALLALLYAATALWEGVTALRQWLAPKARRLAAELASVGREAVKHLKEAGTSAAEQSMRLIRLCRERLLPLTMVRGRAVWNTARQWCSDGIRAAKTNAPIYGARVKGFANGLARSADKQAHRAADVFRAELPALRRHAPRRAMAMALTLCMALTMLPVGAFAAEESACPHDLGRHDETCGYREAVEGAPCGHVEHDENCGYVVGTPETPCDKDCTDTDGDGVIDHVPDCAYTPATEGQPCKHEQDEHDESCGFAEPVAGSPCLHTHDESCGGLVDTADDTYLPPETTECTCGAVPDENGVTIHSEDCPLYAASELPAPGLIEITALEGAPEAIQTAMEGALEALNLPDTLSAIYSIRADTEIVEPDGKDVYGSLDVPTTWDGLPNPAVKGEYTLTANLTLPEGYVLAEGVEAPTVALTLTADPDVDAVRALMAALPTPEQVAAMLADEAAYDEDMFLAWAEQAQGAMDAYEALSDSQKALLPDAQSTFDALMAAFRGEAAPMIIYEQDERWTLNAKTVTPEQVTHIFGEGATLGRDKYYLRGELQDWMPVITLPRDATIRIVPPPEVYALILRGTFCVEMNGATLIMNEFGPEDPDWERSKQFAMFQLGNQYENGTLILEGPGEIRGGGPQSEVEFCGINVYSDSRLEATGVVIDNQSPQRVYPNLDGDAVAGQGEATFKNCTVTAAAGAALNTGSNLWIIGGTYTGASPSAGDVGGGLSAQFPMTNAANPRIYSGKFIDTSGHQAVSFAEVSTSTIGDCINPVLSAVVGNVDTGGYQIKGREFEVRMRPPVVTPAADDPATAVEPNAGGAATLRVSVPASGMPDRYDYEYMWQWRRAGSSAWINYKEDSYASIGLDAALVAQGGDYRCAVRCRYGEDKTWVYSGEFQVIPCTCDVSAISFPEAFREERYQGESCDTFPVVLDLPAASAAPIGGDCPVTGHQARVPAFTYKQGSPDDIYPTVTKSPDGTHYSVSFPGSGYKVICTATVNGKSAETTTQFIFDKNPAYTTVTLDPNGGTITLEGKDYTAAHSVRVDWRDFLILPGGRLEGHSFAGWYTQPDFGGSGRGERIGSAGDSYTPTGDITLYAQWYKDFVAPVIASQPGDEHVALGESKYFPIFLKDNDAYKQDYTCSFQWYHIFPGDTDWVGGTPSDEPGISSGGRVEGTRAYYCIITATQKSTGRNASVTSLPFTITAGKGTLYLTPPGLDENLGTHRIQLVRPTATTTGGGAVDLYGEPVEYAYNTENVAPEAGWSSSIGWQEGSTQIEPDRDYYFFARLVSSTKYMPVTSAGALYHTQKSQEFAITTEIVGEGLVNAPKTAQEGSMVTLSATPGPGLRLKSLTVEKAGGGTCTLKGGNTFKMPMEAVTIKAVFTQFALGEGDVELRPGEYAVVDWAGNNADKNLHNVYYNNGGALELLSSDGTVADSASAAAWWGLEDVLTLVAQKDGSKTHTLVFGKTIDDVGVVSGTRAVSANDYVGSGSGALKSGDFLFKGSLSWASKSNPELFCVMGAHITLDGGFRKTAAGGGTAETERLFTIRAGTLMLRSNANLVTEVGTNGTAVQLWAAAFSGGATGTGVLQSEGYVGTPVRIERGLGDRLSDWRPKLGWTVVGGVTEENAELFLMQEEPFRLTLDGGALTLAGRVYPVTYTLDTPGASSPYPDWDGSPVPEEYRSYTYGTGIPGRPPLTREGCTVKSWSISEDNNSGSIYKSLSASDPLVGSGDRDSGALYVGVYVEPTPAVKPVATLSLPTLEYGYGEGSMMTAVVQEEPGHTYTYEWRKAGKVIPGETGPTCPIPVGMKPTDERDDLLLAVTVTAHFNGQTAIGEYTSLAAAVTRRALTLSVPATVADTKIYDGKTTAAVTDPGTLNGALPGDDVGVSATARYSKKLGTNLDATVTYTLTGADAGCYTAPQSATYSIGASVTPAPLTVTGAIAASREYDGTTDVAVSGGALSGVIGGEQTLLNATSAKGMVESADAGENKAVAVAGYSIYGMDSNNYTLIQPTDVMVSITSRNLLADDLTITGIDDSYPYTGQQITPVPVITLTGGGLLVKDRDYTLSYGENTEIGEAAGTITVVYTGNYTGGGLIQFGIVNSRLPGGTGNDDIFTLSGADLGKWRNEDIVLTTKSGWTVGTEADSLGASVTLSAESTKVDGSIVPSSAELFVKDSAGKVYQTTVTYLLDKTAPTIIVDGMGEDGVNKIWADEKTITIHITDELSGMRYAQILGQVAGDTLVEYGDPSWGYTPFPDDGTITYTVKANDVYTITAYDNADNQPSWEDELPTFVVEKIDREKPTATFGAITGTQGADGWFTGDITVNVNVEDPETISNDPDTIAVNESNKSGIAKWEYSLDGGEKWATGSGTSFTIDTNGNYTDKLKLRATDNAGNVSEIAATGVKLDETIPIVAPEVKAGGDDYTPGTATARDVVVTLANSASNISSVTYSYQEGALNGDIWTPKDGADWAELDENVFTVDFNCDTFFAFKAVSGAGAESTPAIVAVKRSALGEDELAETEYGESNFTVAPDKSGDWYTELPTVTADPKDTVGAGGLDAVTYYELYKAPNQSGDKTELTGTTIKPDSDGIWTLRIWTEDAAGNHTKPYSITLMVDTTAPTVTDIAGNPGTWQNTDAAITFKADDATSGVKTVTVTCGDGQSVTYTGDSFTADRNGTYTITVTDEAGHTATETVAVDKIDKAPPAVEITANNPPTGTNDWYTSGDIRIVVSIYDPDDEANWEYTTDNGATWTTGSGQYFFITESGDYTGKVRVRATDRAGNVTESNTLNIKLDKEKPENPTVTATAGGEIYVSGAFTGKDILFTLSSTPTVSGVARYQYSAAMFGGWKDITGDTFTHSENTTDAGVTYYFRTVNGAGKESFPTEQFTVKRRALNESVLTDPDNVYEPDELIPSTPNPAPNPGDTDFPYAPYWWTELPTITVPEIPYIKDPTGPVIPGTDPAIHGYEATTYYKLWREGTDAEPGKTELQAPFTIKPNADGIWTLELWIEDSVGSETMHLIRKIQLDTTAPTVTDVTGNATAWQKTDVTLTVNGASDATSGLADLAYSFDGGATWQTANAKTFAATATVAVWVRDKAGNTYKHVPIAIDKIDKTAPVVAWDTATATLDTNKWYGKTALTAAATDDSGESLTVTLTSGGKSYANGSTIDKNGSYTFYAAATDGAGNVGRSADLTVRIETAIDEFVEMVDGLNNDSDYQDILDVVNWYNGQSTTIKDRFSKSDDATAAHEKLMGLLRDKAQEAANGVADAIKNADTIDEIEQAGKDYDSLPDEAKDKIDPEIKKELEQKKQDADAAQKVIDQLENADRDKGANGSKDPGGSIDEKQSAQDAYKDLTDDQKALANQVPDAVEDKGHIDGDLSAIDNVLDLLGNIKKPYTPATKDQIKGAQDAYDALTDKQKDAFPKSDKAKLDALGEMRSHAQNAEDKIEALGDNPSQSDLNTAKGTYDSLTADEKAMVDGALKSELDQKYQDMLNKLDADEKAAAEFAAKVEEVKNAPTVDKIKDLIKDHDTLSDTAKDKLTDQTKTDYEKLVDDLNKAQNVIDKLDNIDLGNLTPNDMSDIEDALGKDGSDGYEDLTGDQKKLVDEATDGKAGILDDAVKDVADATDKIEDIPNHSGDSTDPGGGPNLGDCENTGNENASGTGSGGHTHEEHRKAIEEAKIAYEKLTDAGRKLISDEVKERLNNEYAALMAYLEYVNTAKTAKTTVEVAGLAEKVELPAESASAPKTVITVVMVDSKPKTMPPTPAGKTEALSVDIKLVARIYDNPDATAADTPIAQEQVQPKVGQAVLVKLKVPSGYQNDTLELWHVKDNGGRSRIEGFWLVTEADGVYAVFEVSSFSHFVFFAEKTPTGGGGTGGGTVTPTPKPDVPSTDNGSTSVNPQQPKPGDTVTITPKPDEGYVVDDIIVTDQNGKDIPVKDNGDGSYSYTQPKGKVTVTVTFKPAPKDAQLPFTDVNEGDWFYESVKYVYEKGLMNGTASDKFSPYLDTSRGMIVTILWRLEGAPETAAALPFNDVATDSYCAKAVAWGAENAIVKGYGNGSFGPNDPITREQLAAILYRYAQFKGMDTTAANDLKQFSDQPSAWAVEAIRWAVGAGIINGKGGSVLDPTGKATRAETAVMQRRYLELMIG